MSAGIKIAGFCKRWFAVFQVDDPRMKKIQQRVFQGSKGGVFAANREPTMVQRATAAAEGWINGQDGLEIDSINVTVGRMSAMGVVWYYEADSA